MKLGMWQRLGIVLLVLWPAYAMAQECVTIGSEQICHPPRGDQILDPINDDVFRRRVADARRRQAKRQADQQAEQDAVSDLHKRVGAMAAGDDCKGAISEALRAGDFDLAEGRRQFARRNFKVRHYPNSCRSRNDPSHGVAAGLRSPPPCAGCRPCCSTRP